MDVFNPTWQNIAIYILASGSIAFALFALAINIFPSDCKKADYPRYDSIAAAVKIENNRSKYGYGRGIK